MNSTEGQKLPDIASTGRNIGWVLAAQFLRVTVGLILLNSIAPERWGFYAVGLIAIEGLKLLGDLGLASALIATTTEVQKAAESAFILRVTFGFVAYLLAFIAAPLIAVFFNNSGELDTAELVILLRLVTLPLILEAIGAIPKVMLQKQLRFGPIVAVEVTELGIYCLLALLAVLHLELGIFGVVYAVLASNLSKQILVWLVANWRPRHLLPRFSARQASALLAYGKWAVLGSILVFINTNLDNTVVVREYGPLLLGVYMIAGYTYANIPATHISSQINKVMFPTLARLGGDRVRFRQAYLAALEMNGLIAIPFAVGLALTAPGFIAVILPDWGPAVPILRVLCWMGALRALAGTQGQVFNSLRKPQFNVFFSIGLLVSLAIGLGIIVLVGAPLIWVAVVATLPYVLILPIQLIVAHSMIGFSWPELRQSFMPTLVATSGMAAIVFILMQFIPLISPAGFLILVGIGILAYGAILDVLTEGKIRKRLISMFV